MVPPVNEGDDEEVEDTVAARLGVVTHTVADLVNFLAMNFHETWAEQKLRDGWSFGPQIDYAVK